MLALPGAASAQPVYPVKPILVILPLGAGSGSDVAIRTLTERLSAALKQQVVVENQPGAAGLIGAERAAKAAPDGYTLTGLNNMIMATLPHIYEKAGYDPFKSFVPITIVASIPTGLLVHPSLPVRSVKNSSRWRGRGPGNCCIRRAAWGVPSISPWNYSRPWLWPISCTCRTRARRRPRSISSAATCRS